MPNINTSDYEEDERSLKAAQESNETYDRIRRQLKANHHKSVLKLIKDKKVDQ